MDKNHCGDQFYLMFHYVPFICSLLYLTLINGLRNNLKSKAKLFADYTYLLTIVNDKNESYSTLNSKPSRHPSPSDFP